MNMNLPHLKNLIFTDILENQNTYAEFHSETPDQFMVDVTEYCFRGAYILDVVDVVTVTTADALRILLNISQNANGKVTFIPHVSVTSGSLR